MIRRTLLKFRTNSRYKRSLRGWQIGVSVWKNEVNSENEISQSLSEELRISTRCVAFSKTEKADGRGKDWRKGRIIVGSLEDTKEFPRTPARMKTCFDCTAQRCGATIAPLPINDIWGGLEPPIQLKRRVVSWGKNRPRKCHKGKEIWEKTFSKETSGN